jgi:FliI/YscN family ATPase
VNALVSQIQEISPVRVVGRIVSTEGHTATAAGFPAPIGAMVAIQRCGGEEVQAEVVGFREQLTLLYPLGEMAGVRPNDSVRLVQSRRMLRVGPQLLGRIVDSHGECIDGGPQVIPPYRVPLISPPPAAVTRPRIDRPFDTGIRAIDGMLTCGHGQRMGIFSGSGVGKSMAMGMLARYSSADVNVIGLIGERGREVNEFIERDLGPKGRKRSVVVVSTSDEPALRRVQAAFAATAIAEYFRDCGKSVLLVMDSLTRFAMAQREIGLAAGEPPTTRGYPPSVFGMLPKLVERAGRSATGCITAFYTVLVEGDDDNEPISDTVRGLIDGHTVLSRKLAGRGHFPAIDVLKSVSRLMNDVASEEHRDNASLLRQTMSAYDDHEDLISIGAYQQGSNPLVDAAIAFKPAIDAFLKQSYSDSQSGKKTVDQLASIADAIRQHSPKAGYAQVQTVSSKEAKTEPANQQPANQQPANQQPANQQPANQQPANQQPTNSQTINPQPVNPQTVNPQTVNPQTINPQTINPQPATTRG